MLEIIKTTKPKIEDMIMHANFMREALTENNKKLTRDLL